MTDLYMKKRDDGKKYACINVHTFSIDLILKEIRVLEVKNATAYLKAGMPLVIQDLKDNMT